ATEQHPNLIISDIGMPDVDGYQLMRTLRETAGLEDVPAIALTGYARDEDRELALAAGYNAHISKPANMGRLLSLIMTLTGKNELNVVQGLTAFTVKRSGFNFRLLA